MHTVRLLLKTTAYDRQQMDRRFRAIGHIHNVTVKHAIHLLQKLKFNKEYQSCLEEYALLLKKAKISKDDKARRTELSGRMSEIRIGMGLSEYGLQAYIKSCAARFREMISSQQVQKEVTRVYKGVEKVLFGNGRKLHFKKYMDFNTICGKSNTNGVKFNKETLSIEWLGLTIPCKVPKKDREYDYLMESLGH